MSEPGLLIDNIVRRSYTARDSLAARPDVGRYVDCRLPIPRPFLGSGEIKLIIIGQDPTIKNAGRRGRINTVLNLDRKDSLRRYLAGLCEGLGISLDENVYATNAAKCFFTAPPAEIHKREGVNVLAASAALWLPILADELAVFPDAAVVSLGQPVLAILVKDGSSREVRDYWGYDDGWKQGAGHPMTAIEPEQTTLGRRIYPFPHQPSMSKRFYIDRISAYTGLLCAGMQGLLTGPV
jgi:uracil-DNA glycosylase